MKRLLLLVLLLCSLPTWAAIAGTGSCSAAASSCTLNAVNTGDLVVCQAVRIGSTTAPTNPGTMTSIATLATSTGGTPGAKRLSCRKANSGSDTGSGTFTNATLISCRAYSGTAVNATGDCNSTGVNGSAASLNQAKTSTTITYGSLTLSQSGGTNTSWVAGFAGDSAAIPAAPSGMTSVNSAGTGTRVSDTAATVTSWSGATVSVTSSTWLSATVEILAPTPPPATCTGAPCPTSALNDINTTPSAEPSAPLPNNFKLTFPNPVGSGNLLWCGLTWLGSSITVSTVTDTQSNTWSAGVTATGTSNPGSGIAKTAIWYAPNANAGVTTVTFTFSGATNAHFKCGEFYNVATSNPVDVTSATPDISSSGTAVTVAAGSQTTTVDNDLIVYYALDLYGPIGNFGIATRPTSYSVANGWTKLAGNYSSGIFSEYLIWGAHGAINPSMVVNSSGSNTDIFNAVAVSFKAATAGTPPPVGIRITNLETLQADNATSYKIEFPCTGNLMAFGTSEATSQDNFTAVSDTNSNTWTKVTDVSGMPQLFHADNATTSSGQVVTITHAAFQGGSQALYCIQGAATAPFDTSATAVGTSPNGGSFTNAPSITPSTSNGLIIGQLANGIGPETAASSPIIFDNIPYTNETDNGQMNSGDVRSHYYNPSTSSVNFGYTVTTASNGETWQARATAFKAAAAAATGARKRVIVKSE